MHFSRRAFLKSGTAASTLPLSATLACGSDESLEPSLASFVHGVASGDPLTDRVMLWTRLTFEKPPPETRGRYEVYSDVAATNIVAFGEYQTRAEQDYTVKVDVTGLAAETTYYYRFFHGLTHSDLGRTRTAAEGSLERARFAVVSCASYGSGYFHVYRVIAENPDFDGVIHLGDYIYEYGNDTYAEVRPLDPPHETLTLEDYRRRYALYRTDPDLQEAHRQHAFMVVWDDHEVANNAWKGGAQNHEAEEGDYFARKAAAQRAFFEWLPIRGDDTTRVYRSFRFGDLLDLFLLDARHFGRDEPRGPNDADFGDAERSLLGAAQEQWLETHLTNSQARWKLVGQQVLMSELPQLLNADSWPGYPAARARFLDLVERQGPIDLVVLTGDIHMSWALDLVRSPASPDYDPVSGADALGGEFVTPSVTSPSLDAVVGERAAKVALAAGYVKHVQIYKRGFIVLDVDRERVQAAWYLFDSVATDDPLEPAFDAAMAVFSGRRFIVADERAAEQRENAPPLAPRG